MGRTFKETVLANYGKFSVQQIATALRSTPGRVAGVYHRASRKNRAAEVAP